MKFSFKSYSILLLQVFLTFSVISKAQHFFPDDESLVADFSSRISSVSALKNGVAGSYRNFDANSIKVKLGQQIKLQRELLARPDFLDHLHEFRPLEQFAIGTANSNVETSFEVSDDFLVYLEAALKSLAKEVSRKKAAQKISTLKKRLEALLDELENKGPDGLLIGIMSGLPQANKDELLSRESMTEKVEYLVELANSEAIDEAEFSEGFDFSKHDLGERDQSFSSLVSELEERSKKVDEVFNLVTLLKFLTDKKRITAANVKKASSKMLNLSKDETNALFDSLGVAFNKHTQGLLSWHKRSYATKVRKETSKFRKDFTVIEMPPYISIFRGCFGGDCSTSSSWAYPNSPFEKDFFIESKGRVVGYVSTTIIKIKGKRYLLLKDLQGPNISPENARVIIDFLHFHFAEKMETEGLAITTRSFINSNNYYAVLKDVMFKIIDEAKKTEPVTFLDSKIRGFLGTKVGSTHYDSPSTHAHATVYVPKEDEFKKVFRTTDSKYDYFPQDPEELEETVYRLDQERISKVVFEGRDPESLQLSLRESAAIGRVLGVFDAKYSSVLTFDEDIDKILSEYLSEEDIERLKESRKELFIKARLGAQDVLKTSVMGEFMRTHQELLWLLENAEDISSLTEIFKIKFVKEKDDWFIDQVRDFFAEGGEIILNNVATLYGAGIRFLPEESEAIIMERVKNDFLLNFKDMSNVEQGHFRYLEAAKYNRAIGRINSVFPYNTVELSKINEGVDKLLRLTGLTREEALQQPVLAKAIALNMITSLDVRENSELIIETFLSLDQKTQEEVFQVIFGHYKEKFLKTRSYYHRHDTVSKRTVELLTVLVPLGLDHVNDTPMMRRIVRDKKVLKEVTYGARLLLALYHQDLTGMRKDDLREVLSQLFDFSSITRSELELLQEYQSQDLAITINSTHINAIFRKLSANPEDALLTHLIGYALAQDFEHVGNTSWIRGKLTSMPDRVPDEVHMLIVKLWIKALRNNLTLQQRQALERDLNRINYEALSDELKQDYRELVETFELDRDLLPSTEPQPNSTLTCQGLLS